MSDSESRGPGFDPHRRNRVVPLSKKLPTVLVKPRKLRPGMTEKLLTGTLSLNTNKQTNQCISNMLAVCVLIRHTTCPCLYNHLQSVKGEIRNILQGIDTSSCTVDIKSSAQNRNKKATKQTASVLQMSHCTRKPAVNTCKNKDTASHV